MEKSMLHHGACFLGDSANGALDDAILVTSADTRKFEFLLGLGD
jgi:hypothetical protein